MQSLSQSIWEGGQNLVLQYNLFQRFQKRSSKNGRRGREHVPASNHPIRVKLNSKKLFAILNLRLLFLLPSVS